MANSQINRINPLRPSIRLSPAHSRTNSRSTSPERKNGFLFEKIDPLLGNLSAESTLKALTSIDAVTSNEKLSHDILSKSIAEVSPSERALGIRAAIAGRNLNYWLKEVQSWTWPNKTEAKEGKGFVPPTDPECGEQSGKSNHLLPPGSNEIEYYGSLPATLVEEYEKRIEEIRDEMDKLDVEGLKEHVLNAHIPSRSRPSSSTSDMSTPPPLSYVQLSDFTAVITAIILHALPFLSRLASLLTTWDVRLLVLRQIPGLLRELKALRLALNSSLSAIRDIQDSKLAEDGQPIFSKAYLQDEHVKLESAVFAVGRRMDSALDALEGRPDSLPENWIDDLERIESDFAEWVVEVERYNLDTEWLIAKEQAKALEARDNAEKQLQDSTEGSSDFLQTETADLDTIEEEPRCEAKIVRERTTAESEPGNDSLVFSQESDSIILIGDASLSTDNNNDREPKVLAKEIGEVTESQPEIEAPRDLKTPTQSHHPQNSPVETPLRPLRLSTPEPPKIEYQETLSPNSFVDQAPSLDSTAKLPTMDIIDDPFVAETFIGSDAKLEHTSQLDDPIDFFSPSATSQESLKPSKVAAMIEKFSLSPSPRTILATTPTPEAARSIPGRSRQSSIPRMLGLQSPASDASAKKPDLHGSRWETLTKSSAHQPASIKSTSSDAVRATSDLTKENTQELPVRRKRKPLQSPIKLSKTRPAKLKIENVAPIPRPRRSTMGSVGSDSDNNPLVFSPENPEPLTSSSNDTMPLTPSLLKFRQPTSIKSHGDHTLREDRLRRLESAKTSDQASFNLHSNRSVSLPLERFINENMRLDSVDRSPDTPTYEPSMKPPGVAKSHRGSSSINSSHVLRPPSRLHGLTRQKSVTDLKDGRQTSRPADHDAKIFGSNTARRAMQHHDQPKSARLRQRLTPHRSLESLGMKRQELAYVEEERTDNGSGSRVSSPYKQPRKPRDHIDEKISSILSTLQGQIHLVDPHNYPDTSSSSSSDRKMREINSGSPRPPSRSFTPAPSLTLTAASPRRYSHTHKMEDSYVKLYHLHHGGESAPTKLFVRTVGEDNQRVMVRVGGGWADLAEYLREYVIHHGRRKISETPRVEIQGLASRSPSYSSPVTHTSGRATPSQPPSRAVSRAASRAASVMSVRPPSSLAIRKGRRGSNISDVVVPRSVTTGTFNSASTPSMAPKGRRLSVPSGSSPFIHAQSPSYTHTSHESQPTPLGLAGPKPRSRRLSMSPEGEKWVADVLEKTRLSTRPFALSSPPANDDVNPYDLDYSLRGHSLPKVRSIGDIRYNSGSTRVSLKGLGNHR
ncbi:hypothetical protein N7495_007719 [Penicillium taxi]|uniref:uncharacterized protein n=1 Tax=Penicillium taxi TaxID=168475 RepID=UPI002545621C|nr:uncharacterized protein N7495_007719 [Penicillium taxi]KAJ5887678.1 hypothetical protein N7495_007719 [Penicillium taxi]